MMKHSNTAPCGYPPQGADRESRGLPFSKCLERYDAPAPNIDTLKKLLRLHGCPENFVDSYASGYGPREFNVNTMRFWKLRDAFYKLAFYSVLCWVRKAPFQLKFDQVPIMLAGTINPQDPFIRELSNVVNMVTWDMHISTTGTFLWPSYIPNFFWEQDLWNTIRLYVLYTIWCTNPALLSVDFSSGLMYFSKEDLCRINALITKAIQTESTIPESTSNDQVISSEVQQLLKILQDGPKSREYLQEKLGVKRNAFLKHYLYPARELGRVVQTERGSSKNQKYKLTLASDVNEKKTGSTKRRDRFAVSCRFRPSPT